jgi:hypothetical protein
MEGKGAQAMRRYSALGGSFALATHRPIDLRKMTQPRFDIATAMFLVQPCLTPKSNAPCNGRAPEERRDFSLVESKDRL